MYVKNDALEYGEGRKCGDRLMINDKVSTPTVIQNIPQLQGIFMSVLLEIIHFHHHL